MKKWQLLVLVGMTGYLGAMNNTSSWKEEVAKYKALIKSEKPEFNSLIQTQLKLVASNEFIRILTSPNPNKQEVLDILAEVPQVLWERPITQPTWIALAMYYAAKAPDTAKADALDDIAILLFDQMQSAAIKSDNYQQEMANLLQNQNPIIQACEYKREKVLQKLFSVIGLIVWRGSKDSQSPLEWAQHQLTESARHQETVKTLKKFSTQVATKVAQLNSSYADNIAYAQRIVAEFQRQNPVVILAPIPGQVSTTQPTENPNSAIRNLLAQQVELPALKAQAQANQEQWERLQHAYQQKLKTDTESSHQSTSSGISAWKKILILVIGFYACKKIYDWWNHKPENQSEESQEYGEEFSADLDQEFYTI